MKINKILFLFLVVFVVFLFLHKLGNVPNGLYVDEAVSAYNSYSILQTGKDEYGKFIPVAIRFFASFTPPLFVYVSVLFIKLFGLTIFAARLTSAISAISSVFVVYLFLKYLNISKNKFLLFCLTFTFATSPWVVFYGRIGYEVYFAFLLFTVGAYFSLKSLTSINFLLPSFAILALSTYASHTQKYLFALWVPLFLLAFRKELNIKKNLPIISKGLLASFLIISPYLTILFTKALFAKGDLFYLNAILSRANNSPLPQTITIPLAFTYEFFARYFAYFSPKSLFFLPDPILQRSMPELSVFYAWMIAPYATGAFVVLKNLKKTGYKFLLFLTLISPIPAALTSDPFSTQRALPFFLAVFFIISIGITKIFSKNNFKTVLVVLIFMFSPLMLWRSYFVLLPKERAVSWSYGYQEVVEQAISQPSKTFVIDNARLKPIYISYAFFSKFPPSKMQELYSQEFTSNYYNKTEFVSPASLGNIEIRPISWEEDLCKEQILVGDALSYSQKTVKEHFLEFEFEIKDPYGDLLFQGYKTNPKLKCPTPEQ